MIVAKYEIDSLRAQVSELRTDMVDALDHIGYILPMAKGYATDHPVGNNSAIVAGTDEFLEAIRAAARAWKGER